MLLSEPPDWLQHVDLGIVVPEGLGGDGARLQDVVIDDDEGLLVYVGGLIPFSSLYCNLCSLENLRG